MIADVEIVDVVARPALAAWSTTSVVITDSRSWRSISRPITGEPPRGTARRLHCADSSQRGSGARCEWSRFLRDFDCSALNSTGRCSARPAADRLEVRQAEKEAHAVRKPGSPARAQHGEFGTQFCAESTKWRSSNFAPDGRVELRASRRKRFHFARSPRCDRGSWELMRRAGACSPRELGQRPRTIVARRLGGDPRGTSGRRAGVSPTSGRPEIRTGRSRRIQRGHEMRERAATAGHRAFDLSTDGDGYASDVRGTNLAIQRISQRGAWNALVDERCCSARYSAPKNRRRARPQRRAARRRREGAFAGRSSWDRLSRLARPESKTAAPVIAQQGYRDIARALRRNSDKQRTTTIRAIASIRDMKLTLRLDPNRLRRWHVRLAERLARRAGTRVSVEWNAAGEPLAIGGRTAVHAGAAGLRLARRTTRRAPHRARSSRDLARHPKRPISCSILPRSAARGADSGADLADQFDGVADEAAALAALMHGAHACRVDHRCGDRRRHRERASRAPKPAAILTLAYRDVLARTATLIIAALDGAASRTRGGRVSAHALSTAHDRAVRREIARPRGRAEALSVSATTRRTGASAGASSRAPT